MIDLYKKITSERFIIAGPCVIESEDSVLNIAMRLKEFETQYSIPIIFKASFDKANRTSISSYRGPGLDEGLRILDNVKNITDMPILTDIHEAWQASHVAEVCDIIQIPAFLCRQTDLLVEAAKTGKIVNIKKAQFLSAKAIQFPIEKVIANGNDKVLLTERGNIFGSDNLVVDPRNIVDLLDFNYPVIMDITHSLQTPASTSSTTGGNRIYAMPFTKMALALGVSGLFFEVHPDPSTALSDGPNMIPLNEFETFIQEIKRWEDHM